MDKFLDPIFAPLKLRGLDLANRIVMAPMTRGFSPDGIPGEDVAAYYRRRAEGGTGLIITEGVGIDHPTALGSAGLGESNVPHMYGDSALAGWRKVVDDVHLAGGKIVPQLWHQGVMREGGGPVPDAVSSRPSGIWGPAGRLTSMGEDYVTRMLPHTAPMTDEQVDDVVSAFVRSAINARDVGFDGIALHGAHGYLIDTFLWGETNVRSAPWGGDRKGRSRFAAEIVRRIREAVGDDLPIFFRFSQWKQQDFRAKLAENPAELEEVLAPLVDAGVDVFDASVRYFDRPEFEGSDLNLAGWAKKLTGKASMTVGGVGQTKGVYDTRSGGPADVDQALARASLTKLLTRFEGGEFDLVGVGRSLLQDPSWTHRLRRGDPWEAFNPVCQQQLF